MISFAGERSFPHPAAAVAAKLSDVGWLVGTLPDIQVTAAAPDRAAWRMKPKLSFVTGHLDSAMERTAVAADAAEFRVATKAMGAASVVRVRLEFRAAPGGGTRVPWAGELVEVTGLLKMVPKGLLQATAETVIAEVWAAVAAALPPD